MYKDQSASELRLSLLGGDLDLCQFNVLDADSIERRGMRIDASIIGASHVLRLSSKRSRMLHEVLACTDVQARSRPLFSGSVEELPPSLQLCVGGGVSYHFESRVSDSLQGARGLAALERRIAVAAARPDEIGLCHRFPRPSGAVGAPVTLVHVSDGGAVLGLRVTTAHSYPNDGAIVFSHTQLVAGHGG